MRPPDAGKLPLPGTSSTRCWASPGRCGTRASPPPRTGSRRCWRRWARSTSSIPTDVYWAGRLTLCGGPDDLDRYDAAFAAYFAGEAPARRAGRRPPSRPSWPPPHRWTPGSGEGDDDDGETPDLATRASADEVLRHRDVAELSVAEREHLRRLFALLVPATPMRPARRRRPSARGADPPRPHGAPGAAQRWRGHPADAPPAAAAPAPRRPAGRRLRVDEPLRRRAAAVRARRRPRPARRPPRSSRSAPG